MPGLPLSRTVYLLLTLATVIFGYLYLRYAYSVTADTMPFAQEIVLVILGTLATIFITALLLNQQTAVEIEKEQNIRFLDLKATTYETLLDLVEEMASAEKLDERVMTRMNFLTHRYSNDSLSRLAMTNDRDRTVVACGRQERQE